MEMRGSKKASAESLVMPRMLIAGIVGRLVLHLEARRVAGKILEFLHAELVEDAAGISRERERHVDLALFAKLGGDDDCFAGLLLLILQSR